MVNSVARQLCRKALSSDWLNSLTKILSGNQITHFEHVERALESQQLHLNKPGERIYRLNLRNMVFDFLLKNKIGSLQEWETLKLAIAQLQPQEIVDFLLQQRIAIKENIKIFSTHPKREEIIRNACRTNLRFGDELRYYIGAEMSFYGQVPKTRQHLF